MRSSLQVSKIAVRRFLLEKQGLLTSVKTKSASPEDVLSAVKKLECVQIDPVAAVARNQHLVLSARIPGYVPEALEDLVESRRVFEYFANAMCAIPMDDYPVFEVTRKRLAERLKPELDALGTVVADVLKKLELEGPLPSKAFESAERVHGYWENSQAQAKTKATSHALNVLNDMGLIHVVRREGTTRFFDTRERAIPSELLEQASRISETEARSALLDKYLRAYRVFHTRDSRFGWQRLTASDRRGEIAARVQQGHVVPLDIEGVKTPYFILSEDVEQLMDHADASHNHDSNVPKDVRFLPPLDNLLWHRDRLEDLFDFSYTWEVYTPVHKRNYGYYAMPILIGDRLVGRIDPRLDRDRMRLNVKLLQIEPHIRWTKDLRHRIHRGLQKFARFHRAELGDIERTDPEGLTF